MPVPVPVPVLFAIDEDERFLRDVERELVDRYARSYRVVCVSSAKDAMVELFAAEQIHPRDRV